MSEPRIESFEDFWPYYVGAHRKPGCRALHYLGTTLSLSCVGLGIATANPLWFAAAPVAGYGCAWIGHFGLEGNKPATFGHPFYSLRGDFKMAYLALTGRMADEVTRLYGSPNPEAAAPLLAT